MKRLLQVAAILLAMGSLVEAFSAVMANVGLENQNVALAVEKPGV